VFEGAGFVQHTIETLAPDRAQKAMDAGRRLYGKRDFARYVQAELSLIHAVKPRLVVGDFRLSLSTSAEIAGVPSAVLINAYWSPHALRESWPVPDHPILRLLGERLTAEYFPKAIPRVFERFAAPLDSVRNRHGLGPVGGLLGMLSHADFTLYPDDPWLTPVTGAPASHRYLGPVQWEPPAALPSLDFPDRNRPLVYVTLGSSGRIDVLPVVVRALAELRVNAVVATAGRAISLASDALPDNVHVHSFVPGSAIARRASVVVSNGGSTTGYQALAEGTPLVGLPSNFDQYLAMDAIERAGAGISVKARRASVANVRAAIQRALSDERLRLSAQAVAERFRAHDSARVFVDLVRRVVFEQSAPTLEGYSEKYLM
jgi:UDP:flavonoid glycosyltransferase YjiC (YdhE family)